MKTIRNSYATFRVSSYNSVKLIFYFRKTNQNQLITIYFRNDR